MAASTRPTTTSTPASIDTGVLNAIRSVVNDANAMQATAINNNTTVKINESETRLAAQIEELMTLTGTLIARMTALEGTLAGSKKSTAARGKVIAPTGSLPANVGVGDPARTSPEQPTEKFASNSMNHFKQRFQQEAEYRAHYLKMVPQASEDASNDPNYARKTDAQKLSVLSQICWNAMAKSTSPEVKKEMADIKNEYTAMKEERKAAQQQPQLQAEQHVPTNGTDAPITIANGQ